MRRVAVSLAVVWLVGPFSLWLSSYRPFTGSNGLAATLSHRVGGFELVADKAMTRQQYELLGTDDAVWRTYAERGGEPVFVVLVLHRDNWKSIHPPDICLRGSNMVIDEARTLGDAGLLRTYARDRQQRYLSMYRYGGTGLATGSYLEFFLHHAPRALFRASVSGYLVRVETWIASDGEAAVADAERRCRAFLDAVTPELQRITAP